MGGRRCTLPRRDLTEVVGDFYQRDQLIKGRTKLHEHRVDISHIECSVLNISGKWDCTVPPSQTKATTALASSSDKESVSVNAGHVGMLVGPAGRWQPLAPPPRLTGAPPGPIVE